MMIKTVFLATFLRFAICQNGELYKRMEMPNEFWTPFVFQTYDFAKTKVECGSLCVFKQTDDSTCQGFEFDSNNCHLINMAQVSNGLSNHEDNSVFLNLRLLGAQMEMLADFYEVTSHNYWFEKIKTVKVMEGSVISLDCWNYCVNVLKTECHFYVFDNATQTCYFGDLTFTEGIEPETPIEGDVSLIGLKGITFYSASNNRINLQKVLSQETWTIYFKKS